jgi:hypothetical protein
MEADSGRFPVGSLNLQFLRPGASVPEYTGA